jgi:phospholipase/carboxylesterase
MYTKQANFSNPDFQLLPEDKRCIRMGEQSKGVKEKIKERNMAGDTKQVNKRSLFRRGRLLARPTQSVGEALSAGFHPLDLDSKRDGLLYVPAHYRPDRPAPLLLMLHGAGGTGRNGLVPLLPLADEPGLLLLAPDSREQTWDVIVNGYGPDVAFIEHALAQTFHHCTVDPGHIAIGGFSDGASYALSLGLTNGDLFTHIIAFSPGFMAPAGRQGLPRIYISHGTQDTILPVEQCSRRIVRQLNREGYTVDYHEFNGSHTVPQSVAREAIDWFVNALQ